MLLTMTNKHPTTKPTIADIRADLARLKRRSTHQIRVGEAIAATTGRNRCKCVDAAHFLIPDGGAARQGDDPAVLLRWGLTDLYTRAVAVERAAARRWNRHAWKAVLRTLRKLGPTRTKDIARLRAARLSVG